MAKGSWKGGKAPAQGGTKHRMSKPEGKKGKLKKGFKAGKSKMDSASKAVFKPKVKSDTPRQKGVVRKKNGKVAWGAGKKLANLRGAEKRLKKTQRRTSNIKIKK